MVHLIKTIQMAAKSLMLHRFRSFLSALGIIFGVMAVVAMMAVGEGAKRESLRQIELLGTNNLIVRSVALTESERISAQRRQSAGLTLSDADALGKLPGVERAAAMKAVLVERSGGVSAGLPSVVGVTPDYAKITNLRTAEGRFIAAEHVRSQARVCVLGAAVAGRSAIGNTIKLGSDWFTVIGILADKDYSTGKNAAITATAAIARNSNTDICIPITVHVQSQSADGPGALPEQVDEVWIQATEASIVTALSRVVRDTLARLHRGVSDYELLVPHELLMQKQRTIGIFNLVLGCIAGISLLVGGIGIMNIMLATVSERTREIGVCRAIGARRSDIIVQFLAESVTLTAGGGLIGILLGWIAASLISSYAGWATALSVKTVVTAAVISALVGIFFGLYPAQRAAKMDPIAALKFE
ncbi:MAG TPA: ABC transporter permease [Planctomycetota bacterium]|nr:ABC transporter permease [Planctomycetota bacterium]